MVNDSDAENMEALKHRIERLERENQQLRRTASSAMGELRWRDEAYAAQRSLWFRCLYFLGRWSLWVFAGPSVYMHAQNFWNAWSAWLSGRREEKPEHETRDFLAAILARVMRISLIGILIALLPTIFLIVQVVLLAQQNTRITAQNQQFERQNSLLALEQATKFRELLRRMPPRDKEGKPIKDYIYSETPIARWPPPNQSVIDQIVILGQNETELVVQSLQPLLKDDEAPIASGALLALHRLITDENVGPVARKALRPFADGNPPFFELRINLDKADMRGADLQGAKLAGADLQKANLPGAFLAGANLQAFLPGANLPGANLHEANLPGAVLAEANLPGAILAEANLPGANLQGTDLSGALGLTQDQLNQACVNEQTKLPPGLTRPPKLPEVCKQWQQ